MSEDKWADETWKTPIYACLNCGYTVDAATASPLDPAPRGPREGDTTVCVQCSHIMIFKADQTVRNATPEELAEITSDPDVLQLLQAIRALRATRFYRRHRGPKK